MARITFPAGLLALSLLLCAAAAAGVCLSCLTLLSSNASAGLGLNWFITEAADLLGCLARLTGLNNSSA